MSKYNKYQERAKKLLENTSPEIKDKVEILDEIKRLINLGKVNIFLADLFSLFMDFYNSFNINIWYLNTHWNR